MEAFLGIVVIFVLGFIIARVFFRGDSPKDRKGPGEEARERAREETREPPIIDRHYGDDEGNGK